MFDKDYRRTSPLNKKQYKPLLIGIAILFFASSAKAMEDSNSINGVSLKVLELVKEPWNENSFVKSLSVIQDKRESIRSRRLILEKLNSNAKRLEMKERQQLLQNNIAIAKDANESPFLSALAIRNMAGVSRMMYEKGEITRDNATSEKAFLIETAADKKRDLQLRSSAVKAIEILKINEAIPVLESLLSDANNFDVPEIARSSTLSLTRLSETQAFPYIHKVAKNTADAYVFETAAYCLGQMRTVNAMNSLVQNSGRFIDTGSCDFTLVEMEDIIIDALKQPFSSDVTSAIHATKHLWKKGQKEKYIPLLYDLIAKAPVPVKIEAIKRILSIAEKLNYKEEKSILSEALSKIDNIPEMKYYSDEIRKRLGAKLLVPQISSMLKLANESILRERAAALAVSDYGNMTAQEYGDAVYRFLDAWGLGQLANYNHAGLFAGIDSADSFRVFHAADYYPCVQNAGFNAEFKNSQEYYGAYTHSELDLDFFDRKAIVKTAHDLAAANVYYTIWNAIDPLTSEIPITISNIDNIRCDGVVEYCYEAQDFVVWEPANDRDKWNILYFPDAHNDMPSIFSLNPDIELSPWAQRGAPANTGPWYFGGTNPNNAYLMPAEIDMPTYEVQSWPGNGCMVVQIKAKDRTSGIHRIGYMRPGEVQWSYSRNTQHPDSDTFTRHYNVYQKGWFYYFAQDNGGNFPEYSESVYIDFSNGALPCRFGAIEGKNVKIILKDCNNNDVTFSLTGGGYGEINCDDCTFSNIDLFDTTEKSILTIKTKGNVGTSVGDIICNGPIKGINAKTIDLLGNVEIGSSLNPKAAVTIVFDEASDLTIDSEMPIKSISATEWLTGSINAPLVGSLTIKGDKKRGISGDLADVNLNLSQQPDTKVMALGKLTVKGWIDYFQIISTGNIGRVTAGAIADSSCFAGVTDTNDSDTDGVLDLPDPAVHINYVEPATIKKITIKGIKGEPYPYYINSNIAAAQILSVSLSYPENDNNDVPFGLSAGFIKSLKIKDAEGTVSYKNLDKPGDSKKFEDAEIRLY
ncbi:MAG: HEAT repeat domain-containing protein [Sedimentisphaerales bacterium]|nr:HEAT repeat domain-containing protein [Sedimentisphaerales bacterium]